MRLSFFLVSVQLFVVPAIAETAIPLNEIWGYNLPGTRDILGIPHPEKPEGIGQTFAVLNRQREYNIEQIRLALAMKPPGEKASPGFVVSAQPDSRMLMAVYAHVRGKPNPFRHYPEGQYTLVFFSHPLSYYARLREVKREGNEITVLYQFEPHTTPEATAHFALIPLGKLSAGEYHVDYRQLPLDEKYRELGFEPVHPDAADIVSRDFSFTVTDPLNERRATEGATIIPLDQIWAYKMPGTRDVRELDAIETDTITEHPLLEEWRKIIMDRLHRKQSTGPSFIVSGSGREAWENALRVMRDGDPRHSFSGDVNLNLVFYTHLNGGYYIHVEVVEKSANRFIVKCRFVFHYTTDTSYHFALIPLGELSPGDYDVEIERLPTVDQFGKSYTAKGDVSQLISSGTAFHVGRGQ